MSIADAPRWARAAAAALAAAAIGVLVWGRGGTAVLAGVVLAFLALAVLFLAAPDGDPAADPPADPAGEAPRHPPSAGD